MQLTLQLNDGRVIKKKFSVHGMVEIKNAQPHPHLFADNPQHIEPYAYALGTGRQFFRAGFELEKQLPNLLLATRRRKFLRVWDQKGLVFQAERIDADCQRYEQLVRFTLFKFAGMADDQSHYCPIACAALSVLRARGAG